jgi:hypothetical protein
VNTADRHLLIEHLNALEHQAATVAALIDFDDAELVQEVAEAFAPLPIELKYANTAQRSRWRRQWIAWLADCGERWEASPPPHPAGEDLGEALLRWARS